MTEIFFSKIIRISYTETIRESKNVVEKLMRNSLKEHVTLK